MTDKKTATSNNDSAMHESQLRTEQSIVRLTFWQTILSVVGVVIAVIALYAALTESSAVRRQTSAAVWPYVQLVLLNHHTDESAGFTLGFKNVGVGPAKMQDVRISVDGNVVRDWSELVASVDPDSNAAINRSYISDRVLRPDETVVVFNTQNADLVQKLVDAIRRPRGVINYCYCSIFDECWLIDTSKESTNPEPVEFCPEFSSDTYVN